MMGVKNSGLLVGLFISAASGGTLFGPCENSSQCGTNQECDQLRKECRCEPTFHVWHSNCIPGLSYGQPCQEEISCRLANRKFRCSTTPSNSNPTCNCKQHTRYVGDQCIDAPGFGVFAEPAKHADYTKKEEEVEENDINGVYYTGALLRKFVGPISMSCLILIIVGVCIVFHNAKAAQDNHELPTFTNEAYSREAIYDVPDMEEDGYRYQRNERPQASRGQQYNTSIEYDSESSEEEYSIAKETSAIRNNFPNKDTPMVTIKIEDTDAIEQVNNSDECIEKHDLDVAEKESEMNETKENYINSNTNTEDISEDISEGTLLKSGPNTIQTKNDIADQKETDTPGYKHSMKNLFTNLSEAQEEECNPNDLSISFSTIAEGSEDNPDEKDTFDDNPDEKDTSEALTFTDLAKVNSANISEDTSNKTNTRNQKYLVTEDEAFETGQNVDTSDVNKEEMENFLVPASDESKQDNVQNLQEDSSKCLGLKNVAFDQTE